MADIDDTWKRAQGLVGERVKVIMDYDDENAVQIGELIQLDEEGEFTIVDDDGITHYCWPLLDIDPMPNISN